MGRSDKRKHHNEHVHITILLLQSSQINETAGAACHEEVCQCPARYLQKFLEVRAVSRKKGRGKELKNLAFSSSVHLQEMLRQRQCMSYN